MSTSDFPTIGFDPAPGRLESVDDLTTKLTTATTGLENAYSTLTSISKGGKTWEGEAANAFAQKVGDLPKYIGDSRDALRSASTQLSSWRTELAHYQQKAREYEAEAKVAKQKEQTRQADHDRATSEYNQAAADPALKLAGRYYSDQSELNTAQAKIEAASSRLNQAGQTLDSASRQLDAARGELEAIIKKAEELLEHHQDDARSIADKLRKASDNAPDTGFFEGLADAFTKLGHSIQNWCTKHADLLKKIGDWLSIASAVMGVLSLVTLWCPPLSGAFALAGGALSLGALATHGAAKLGGADVSAMDLIGDGLGVIPFGKFVGTAVKGSTKVAVGVTKIGDSVVTNVDDVQKIARLNGLSNTIARAEDLADDAAEHGGRAYKAAEGMGNKVKLAWESHVADNMGASFKEKRLGDLITKVPGLRNIESFAASIRPDGSLDPVSWWSRGPQLAQAVPGIVTDVYDGITGKN